MTVSGLRTISSIIGSLLAIAAIANAWFSGDGRDRSELTAVAINGLMMALCFIGVEFVQDQYDLDDDEPAFEVPPDCVSLANRWLWLFMRTLSVWPPIAFALSWAVV